MVKRQKVLRTKPLIGFLCGSVTSRELMNSIMISEEASEESGFLSALYGSPGSFVHKALKDEQIECIHRIVCQRCFCRDTNGIRQERYILVNFKSVVLNGPYNRRHIKNHRKTPCFLLAYKVERYLHQVLLLKLTHYERNRRTCFTK